MVYVIISNLVPVTRVAASVSKWNNNHAIQLLQQHLNNGFKTSCSRVCQPDTQAHSETLVSKLKPLDLSTRVYSHLRSDSRLDCRDSRPLRTRFTDRTLPAIAIAGVSSH